LRRITAIPEPQKADETDDPPIHRFRFVDYLANRIFFVPIIAAGMTG